MEHLITSLFLAAENRILRVSYVIIERVDREIERETVTLSCHFHSTAIGFYSKNFNLFEFINSYLQECVFFVLYIFSKS